VLSWGIVPASRANGDLNPHTLLGRAGPARGTACRQGLGPRRTLPAVDPHANLRSRTESVESADRLMDTLAELSSLVRERETQR